MSTHAAPLEAIRTIHSLRDLPFVKMHGTGNDFVVLDALRDPVPADFDFDFAAQNLCERRRGIGGDGLLLLEAPDEFAREDGAVIRMRMWNPDGSEDMCGNGLRCIARLAHARGHVSQPDFTVQTLAGLRRARIETEIVEASDVEANEIEAANGADNLVRVSMGAPDFALDKIPMQVPLDVVRSMKKGAIEYVLPVGGVLIPRVSTLSTGTTHTVIFLDAPLDDVTFAHLSPLIEHHAWFPERTSIMWAHVLNRDTLRLRIWERGAGETLACGTGACACAVAMQMTGRGGENIRVQSRGGELSIHWNGGDIGSKGGEIEMSGPARIVYQGRFQP